jgi:hypothetical protein
LIVEARTIGGRVQACPPFAANPFKRARTTTLGRHLNDLPSNNPSQEQLAGGLPRSGTMRVRLTANVPASYPEPGCCIYCGAEDHLSEEHIIADALGGRLTIPRASCADCADITSALELRVIRGLYGDARAAIGMKRGHGRRWPKKFPVQIDRSVSWKNLTVTKTPYTELEKFDVAEVEAIDHPGAMVCPILNEPAGFLTGNLDHHKRTFKIAVAYPDGFKERLSRLGGGAVIGGYRPDREDFGRFLAKIAHSFAVGLFGIGSFIPVLTPLIRGEGDLTDIWRYVGAPVDQIPIVETNHLHVLSPIDASNARGRLLIVRIRLFASNKLPAYDVIVGIATRATLPISSWGTVEGAH